MKKLAWLEKLLMVVTACGFVLFALTGSWLYNSEVEPEVNIPLHLMPQPNAMDYYTNAAVLMIPAPRGRLIDPSLDYTGRSWENTDPRELKRRFPVAVKEAWLQQNRPALSALRQGFAYPSQYPAPNATNSYWNVGPVARLIILTRLLAVESHVYRERGDWKAASGSALDLLKLGSDYPRGGPVRAWEEGQCIQSMGRDELWQCLPHLDRGAAKTDLARLRHIDATQASYIDSVREQKYWDQCLLISLFHSFNWRHGAMIRATRDRPENTLTWAETLQLETISKRTLMHDLTVGCDARILAAQRPFRATAAPAPAADPYCRSVLNYPPDMTWAAAHDSALNDLLLVSLALRVYALEHGAYPSQLSALVPGYLQAVPADPCDSGAPLRYRRDGGSAILWSVGPDGKVDGGHSLQNRRSRGRSPFIVSMTSQGDIVAGPNP